MRANAGVNFRPAEELLSWPLIYLICWTLVLLDFFDVALEIDLSCADRKLDQIFDNLFGRG